MYIFSNKSSDNFFFIRTLVRIGVVLLALIGSPQLHAQFRTSIQGAVTDPDGLPIPGATLTLKDLQTNATIVRTADASGIFNFNALPADHFALTVEKAGFQKQVLDNLQLIPEQANSLDVKLAIGVESTTVTVDASLAPALDTQTANTGQTITDNEIQHIPVYQRDVTSLIQLAPGVLATGAQSAGGGGFQAPGTQTGASSGGGGNLGHSSSIFATENGASANANGAQFGNNGYSIDGISTASAVWGGSTVVTPSQDSVDNVKIVTNAYDAENGRFSGALTEITSKSGTNHLHGSFFIQIARPGLNAYQRWNGPGSVQSNDPITGAKLTPAQRGLLRDQDFYNQLGGSIGGPIWKNRVFAFFAYEGQSQSVSTTSTQWFPTAAFAQLAPANSISSTYLNFKGAAVAGTLIASNTCTNAGLTEGVNCRTISGQGLNVGSPLTIGLGKQDLSYVSATTPGVGSGLSNTADIAQYNIANPTTSDFKQYNGRLDANVTGKDHVSFAIYWVPTTLTRLNGGLGYQIFNHSQTNDAFSRHLESHLLAELPQRSPRQRGRLALQRASKQSSSAVRPAPNQLSFRRWCTDWQHQYRQPRCARAWPSRPMDLRLQGRRHQGAALADNEVRIRLHPALLSQRSNRRAELHLLQHLGLLE